MPWNPDQYHKFQAQRSAPFDDLLNLVIKRRGIKAIDLGCGTGELTYRLSKTLPESLVHGLDNSPQMLGKTKFQQNTGLTFELGDLATIQGNWDLIFSNAALQWSENHAQLVSHLFFLLNPGGQIAVQVPSNHTHMSHQLIAETAKEEPFRTILGGYVRVSPVLQIEDYARLLYELGAENVIVFEKIYPHLLENSNAIIDWVSGTTLVPYFERLGTEKEHFLSVLSNKMHTSFPTSPIFYPFKRTFFSAQKTG
ncbi:MAG: methyltransferase domain-containing protein [Chloroflexota bacterium]